MLDEKELLLEALVKIEEAYFIMEEVERRSIQRDGFLKWKIELKRVIDEMIKKYKHSNVN